MVDTAFATNGQMGSYVRPNTREMGTTGLNVTGGRIYEEFDRAWRDDRKRRTIREMTTDPYVSRSLWTFELLIRNTPWSFESADDSNEALEGAEFASQVLFEDQSYSWNESLSDHLTMLHWGWSYHELVWKRRLGHRSNNEPGKNSKFNDGRWGLRKTAFRGQDTLHQWMIDQQGGVQGMIQMDHYASPSRGTVRLPIQQSLLFRLSTHHGNPEGRSLLRAAYIPWYRKKNYATIQGIGIERKLAGLPYIKIPSTMWTDPQYTLLKSEYERMGRNIRIDEQGFVMLPSDRDEHGNALYEFSLVASAGSDEAGIQAAIDTQNKEIVIALMTDVVLIGHEQVGSLALHSSTTELMSFGLGGVMDAIAEVYNRHFMPRLWSYNGLPHETMPKLVHGDIEQVDLDELGNFVVRLAQGGFDILDLENEIRRRAGFPLKEEIDMEEEPTRRPIPQPGENEEEREDEETEVEAA